MKRRLFNSLAGLSLLLCLATGGTFFIGLLTPPASWTLNLRDGYRLMFNKDEVMLQRWWDGHGGFPVTAGVFYMMIAIPAAVMPTWWAMTRIKERDRRSDTPGFPVVQPDERIN